jgi:hypothetical protein
MTWKRELNKTWKKQKKKKYTDTVVLKDTLWKNKTSLIFISYEEEKHTTEQKGVGL